MIFMESVTEGDWRTVTFWIGFLFIVVVINVLFLIEESPRFLITHDNYEEAFEIMDKMGKKNEGNAIFYSTEDPS